MLALLLPLIFPGQGAQTQPAPARTVVVGLPAPIRARGLLSEEPGGETDGFARRLMEVVAERVGLTIEFRRVTAPDLLDELLAGQVDVLGPLSIQIERLDQAAFTTPIFIADGAAYVRSGADLPGTVEDLRTLRVGVAGAGIGHKFCIEQGLACETGPTLRTELDRLAQGELDCVVTTRIAGRIDIEHYGIHGLVEAPLAHEGLRLAFAFGVRPADRDLLARINTGLALARDDGTWDELYDRWVSPYQPRPHPRGAAPYVIAALAVLGAGSVFFALRLRVRLSSRTRELDESERRYLAVAESLPALVYSYFVGDDGRRERRFTTSNIDDWRALFPELDPGGNYLSWIEAVHPDDRAAYHQSTQRSRTERVRFDVEFRLRGSDGRYHHLHSVASPLVVAGGVLWQSLLLDTTPLHEAREERHQLELQLLQSQKLEGLGLLAGGIAHDFNNLLMALRGNLELAARAEDDAARSRRLAEAQQATQRASELTHQLLAYAGRAQLVESSVALDEVVREMSDMLGSTLQARAQLTLEFEPGPLLTRGDATLIRQVVMNLLTNAVEAIPAERQGHIALRIRRLTLARGDAQEHTPALAPGNYLVLEVEDDGRGMDEATRARMFDPFFSTKFTGRGLGLSVLQRTIQRHGGAWLVRSKPEVGSCFRILLPATVERPVEESTFEITPQPRRSARVLVVDDDARVRSVVTALLGARGHVVEAAADDRQALALAASFRPDAILLDLTMPGRGGLELLPLLRRERPCLPVVLMSGYSERDVARAGVRVDGFLAKPFSASDLARVVEAALETPAG